MGPGGMRAAADGSTPIVERWLEVADGQSLVVRLIDGQSVFGTVLPNGDFLSADGTILELPNGFVEHGALQPNGYFLAKMTVNGQEVWGNYGSDGSFLSQSGTIYVSPSGQVETGITDPGTGEFLPNGVVRQIDGQTVYGTVGPNGDFVSEDGSILQKPDGFVEHGKIDSDGDFLAEMTVNGQEVWGSYGSDGSFLSQSGTIYVSPSGQVETGITAPDGNFLPGGTTYTTSSGTVLYGYKDAGSFYTYDGSTIVLDNSTVVTGSLNQSTGIFTGNNGDDYFVGQNGIVKVTPQPDGSFLESNGTVIMTAQSWAIDLAQFSDAMQAVGTNTTSISDAYESIRTQYSVIETVWSSPAGTSFADITSTIDNAMSQLNSVLESIGQAMHTSYNNYLQTEQANTNNFTGS
jgi:WXG100 family type VII secretion target